MSDAVAHNAFQPGEEVRLRVDSHHARSTFLNPYEPEHREQIRYGRRAEFIRYMAGNVYAIVHAEPWGIVPARDTRVLVEDLVRLSSTRTSSSS